MATAPGPSSVQLPNGREATSEEMQSYGQALQNFIHQQEALLPQIKDTRRHNQIIDYLQLLSDSYNEQLGLYKAVEARRQLELPTAQARLQTRY